MSMRVTKGNPGSPLATSKILSFSSQDISSARKSPHVGSENARPLAEAMQGAMPAAPLSYWGDWPVGIVAITVAGFVVRSKTTTELLPLPINRVLPSAVMASPSGADRGLTPLAREAQHCAPGNPPNI